MGTEPIILGDAFSTADPREKLSRLLLLRNELTFEIQRLRAILGLPLADRPRWECKRCGYSWMGFSADRAPKGCPRCHSPSWNEPPMSSRARRPEDPPHPNWGDKGREGPFVPRKVRAKVDVPAGSLVLVPVAEVVRGSSNVGLPPPPPISEWEAPRPLAELLREKVEEVEESTGDHVAQTVEHFAEGESEIVASEEAAGSIPAVVPDQSGGGSTVERDPSKVDQAGSTPVPRSIPEEEEVHDDPADPSPSKPD